jgi:hypothetical protein
MSDHERIDELLAGYVLRSLSGADEAEADRVLADHVPRCDRCRSELTELGAVASDLALAAPPLEPPATLLPRLRRQLGPVQQRRRPRGRLAVAASVVAVFGLAGTWMQGQISETGTRRDALATILNFARDHGAEMQPVGQVTRVAAPDVREMYLYGERVPSPPNGAVYGVWLVTDGVPRLAGTFVPDGGWVYLRVTFDAAADELLITLEPEGARPQAPGEVVWRAA